MISHLLKVCCNCWMDQFGFFHQRQYPNQKQYFIIRHQGNKGWQSKKSQEREKKKRKICRLHILLFYHPLSFVFRTQHPLCSMYVCANTTHELKQLGFPLWGENGGEGVIPTTQPSGENPRNNEPCEKKEPGVIYISSTPACGKSVE